MIKWAPLCNIYNSLHPKLEIAFKMRDVARKSESAKLMKHLAGLLLLLPCTVNAEIYRCESKGDTYFSQIPCNDQAEAVVIEDTHLFKAQMIPPDPEAGEGVPRKAQVRTPADNLREFVETLQRQRNEQMAQVDGDISSVEQQLAATEGAPADDPERLALAEKLAELNSSRASISSQYESMIAEAERRVAEMSAGAQVEARELLATAAKSTVTNAA